MYGISQHSDIKDYIIVLQDGIYCEKCGNQYTSLNYKWCKQCQINNLKQNFECWTSGSKVIDNYIQEMQLKINRYDDIIIEWIPYSQFKEISKGDSIKIYSAMWMNGLLKYKIEKQKYERIPNTKVTLLMYIHNSQNNTNELLNEVRI
jgi:hypothetical protein